MSFTSASLNVQNLLETTFISDMRLIVNANNALFKSQLESLINTFEIDLVNKYLGVDNYFNQVKVNNVVLGNSITFMDSTSTIASLTKSAGKSTLSVDKIVIQPGGSIDNSGAANTMVSKRLGIGLSLADVLADGFYVGNASTSATSVFYGPVTFAKQSIAQSTETASLYTEISSNAVTLTGGTGYYGEVVLSKTSKQFIYVRFKAPVAAVPTSSNPIYIGVYESATSVPDAGQSFTIILKEYTNATGTAIPLSNWGDVYIVPGHDISSTSTRIPVIINGGSLSTSGTSGYFVDNLNTLGSEIQHVMMYNTNIQSSSTNNKFGASVNFTKFETITNASRYVITSSHNIEILN